MNKISIKNIVAVLFFMCIAFLAIDSASAHRVIVYAWVDGDTIYVESKFAGGKKVNSGKISVVNTQGAELLSGLTNEAGEFSFKIPKRIDLKIVIRTGQGHQGEWTIRAAEMADLQYRTAPETDAGKASPFKQKNTVPKISVDTRKATPNRDIQPNELEAIIESVLDRKLKPITRMLADIRHKGPTARDIFAGIGYIFGLAGIVAYVQSRKKKG